ncbi:GNAT family protein [Candidatus Tisiphia endosymbiont of Beris chalybata]|uniref:GNAT family N-acetyltransferase n=1 Tax=Candidatus Tisiphia endosymbiont of Beris chalybata TaxID=3066262 RepID=UPI00312C6D15
MFNHSLYYQFPILDLDDIVLRELSTDDAEEYLNYMIKPEMLPFLTDNNIPKNIAQAIEEVKYWSSLFRNRRGFYWAIALKSNNKLIGTAGFNSVSTIHLKAEISYDLDPAYWGRGIMLKSIKNILKFIGYAGVVRIQATVVNDNIRSINLLERCNFTKEGLLKKYEIIQSAHRDYYLYAKIN